MRTIDHGVGRGRRRGSALVMVTMAAAVLATLSFSILTVSLASSREQRGGKERMRARYVCEAALSDAVFDLSNGGNGNLGTVQDPVEYGNGEYWVATTPLADSMFQIVATGREERVTSRLELTVRRVISSLWRRGAFGDESMELSGNARTDSYDSTAGTYEAQLVGSYAKTNGDVGCNAGVSLDQDAQVWGDAAPGPGFTPEILQNAAVSGSTVALQAPIALPAINVPALPMLPAVTYSGGSNTILAGDYYYQGLTVDGDSTLTVYGPARLVFDDFHLMSNAQMLIDATAGPVELYVNDDFILDSNSLLGATSLAPADLSVALLSDNITNPEVVVQLDEVSMDSNAKMYGTLYAPQTEIEVDSNFQLFGAVMARRITLDSNAKIHYDEALPNALQSGPASYATVCWRVVSAVP